MHWAASKACLLEAPYKTKLTSFWFKMYGHRNPTELEPSALKAVTSCPYRHKDEGAIQYEQIMRPLKRWHSANTNVAQVSSVLPPKASCLVGEQNLSRVMESVALGYSGIAPLADHHGVRTFGTANTVRLYAALCSWLCPFKTPLADHHGANWPTLPAGGVGTGGLPHVSVMTIVEHRPLR